MEPNIASPQYDKRGVQLFQAEALSFLQTCIFDQAPRCCVTSPPYFGLRDYGLPPTKWPAIQYTPLVGVEPIEIEAMECCLGLEPTPEAYIGHLIAIFREVRRVLSDDGTLWLNLGDSFANDGKWGGHSGGKHAKALHCSPIGRNKRYTNLPPKSLIGIPWRAAFALQADGWFLRMDCIWNKTNGMPSSVKDRPTLSHEYVFLLAKSKRYYYDGEAVKEPSAASTVERYGYGFNSAFACQFRGSPTDTRHQNGKVIPPESKRRAATFRGQGHFRTEPGGAANRQGRDMTAVGMGMQRPQYARALELAAQHNLTDAHIRAIRAVGVSDTGKALQTQTGAGRNRAEVQQLADEAKEALGGYWREFLLAPLRNKRSVWSLAVGRLKDSHFAVFPLELIQTPILAGSAPGDVILDPFMGAGTTALVARDLGRRAVGCELNPLYLGIAARRLDSSAQDVPLPFDDDAHPETHQQSPGLGTLPCTLTTV